MLGEDFCSGWLHSYLYEMIYILDRSWLIPDQSGHHSPDWFGESIFPLSHRRSNCGKIEGRREQRREGDFFWGGFHFRKVPLCCFLLYFKSSRHVDAEICVHINILGRHYRQYECNAIETIHCLAVIVVVVVLGAASTPHSPNRFLKGVFIPDPG